MVAHLVWDQGAAGSNPVAPTTSEWTLLHSDFSLQKNQSFASSFLLIRKKARSAHLFSCKRSHDGSLSLPPFCESAFGTNISIAQLSLCFVIPPPFRKTFRVLRKYIAPCGTVILNFTMFFTKSCKNTCTKNRQTTRFADYIFSGFTIH